MIVGVTGHQNIPDAALLFVKRELHQTLSRHRVGLIGVSSLAAGADQLFAEIILQLQGRLHVVVPSQRYEDSFTNEAALENFNTLIKSASNIEILPFDKPSEEAYFEAGCKVVSRSSLIVAVWDGEGAKGEGGTADIVHFATACQKSIQIIWPEGVHRK